MMFALEVHDTAWIAAGLPAPPAVEPAGGYAPGDLVRLGFQDHNGTAERAWVRLTVVGEHSLEGRLVLDLQRLHMLAGSRVAFDRRHALDHRFDERD